MEKIAVSTEKKKRGFGSMSPERQKEIASMGGKTVSRNREHMATIGAKGGETIGKNTLHMATIGRKGGKASAANRAKV